MKYHEIILSNATENWYVILYDLVSRLWYIATSGTFCKNSSHTHTHTHTHTHIYIDKIR